MATTLLIRHGQASFGSDDYDQLSPLGRRQAVAVGEYLGSIGKPVHRIVCGTLQRQRATAMAIAQRVRLPAGSSPTVEIDPRLDEVDVEKLIDAIGPRLVDSDRELSQHLATAHVSRTSRQIVLRRTLAYWQTCDEPFDGESWVEFSHRVSSALRDIMGRSGSGHTTVAVSSGGVISAVALDVWDMGHAKFHQLMDVIKNCSITELIHSGDRCTVSSFNETAYLHAMASGTGESLVSAL